jgi:hypothetical protein
VRSKQEIVVIARMAATGLLQLAGHPGRPPPSARCCWRPCLPRTSTGFSRPCRCRPSRPGRSLTPWRSVGRSRRLAAPGAPTTTASSTATCAAWPCRSMISPVVAPRRWASPAWLGDWCRIPWSPRPPPVSSRRARMRAHRPVNVIICLHT